METTIVDRSSLVVFLSSCSKSSNICKILNTVVVTGGTSGFTSHGGRGSRGSCIDRRAFRVWVTDGDRQMTAGFAIMTVQRDVIIAVAAGVRHALDLAHLERRISSGCLKMSGLLESLRDYVGTVRGSW